MGFLIVETTTDADLVWWVELAKKVGARHDYRFGDYRNLRIEDLEKNRVRDAKPADETATKAGSIKNRFTHKIAKKCGRKKR